MQFGRTSFRLNQGDFPRQLNLVLLTVFHVRQPTPSNMAQHSWQTSGIILSHHLYDLTPTPTPSTPARPILISFINGLMLPQSMWTSTLELLKSTLTTKSPSDPASIHAITYDRYGQGESRPSSTEQPNWQPVAHDMVDAARELAGVITCVQQQYFPQSGPQPKIIMVSHSIGVPLVRIHGLLQDEYRSKDVYAHLFLDSNMANNDFTSIFPNPDDDDFKAQELPDDTTVDDLRKLRQRTRAMFHPSISNSERLDRNSLKDQLPRADEPKLAGPNGRSPYLTVVGHDPVAFAEEGFRLNGTPRG